jgi:hypothetical protein
LSALGKRAGLVAVVAVAGAGAVVSAVVMEEQLSVVTVVHDDASDVADSTGDRAMTVTTLLPDEDELSSRAPSRSLLLSE